VLNPIHQFEIDRLVNLHVGKIDLSFTNVSLFMFVTVITAGAFLWFCSSTNRLIPNRCQSLVEIAYEFVAATLRDATDMEGMQFFPFVFSLFIFILVANCIGIFPYFYTITSQIVVTFVLSMLVILLVLIYGFIKHGAGFLHLFVPKGVPMIVAPLVTLIEIISFISRPISLSVRLFANMLAGHITLKVFAGFAATLVGLGVFGAGGAIAPLAMTVALTGLELLVAFLQAYVFTVLTCMYINDAIHPSH